jgi:hypothetical protein
MHCLASFGHGLFLPECQGTQSRSGKQGQVGARGIDILVIRRPVPKANVITGSSSRVIND